MGKVELPVEEPMYSTYHWLSNAGIPAKQNPTSDNWYYNNTVNWQCTRAFLRGLTTPKISVEVGSLWQIPFFDKGGVSTRFARYCSVQLIKTMLDEGYYVAFAGIDDFYIKGKSFYQERHFSHDGMITGYDDENFTMAAYDQRWIFRTFQTPQSGFVEGLEAMCAQGEFAGITAVKAKDDEQILDLNQIRDQLKKYLKADLEEYPVDCAETAKGMIVYDYICMYLDKLNDGSIPYERKDRRIFRMIWEHKKCMLKRIAAVEKECGWSSTLSDAYEEVVNKANKARMIYAKFVLKFSSADLEKLQVLLMQMKAYEGNVLNDFLVQLEKIK